MAWIMLGVLVALAILGPLYGADSRDGRDWSRRPFGRRLRSAGSPAQASEDHASADRHRTAPACG